ncbi:unnamed protein product [Rotaria socialis]|uniref:RING-type domain-containing protein n=1 Tax=Rotaria socialis TaxID=392032 RepID=A0A820YHN7_9BILA|nr:unnamed protein product [Rotaria socialis]CAF4549165.1 unnamed protein product [Rotaria socialis]
MSNPSENSPTSNYLCQNCGTINTNGAMCIQCRSELLEEIPVEIHDNQSTSDNTRQEQLSDNNQQVSVNHEVQNLFNNTNDIQLFGNMLLNMIMSQSQPVLLPQRPRRGRPPRRIKRVAHSLPRRRYIPALDLFPLQVINTQTPHISLLDIDGLLSGQPSNNQLEPSMTLVRSPLQFVVFDQNAENLNPEVLIQLLNEDIGTIPLRRNDINQLPILTMTPSNLSVNPSCAICLENFDPLSEVKQLPICHHVFHVNCLTEWLLRHANCPMCRTAIIPSIQRTPTSIFNNYWMQQLFSRSIIQQQQQQTDAPSSNNLVSYPPVKTTNSLEAPLNTTESHHSSSSSSSSSDIPQLPHFDSQTHTDPSSNIE